MSETIHATTAGTKGPGRALSAVALLVVLLALLVEGGAALRAPGQVATEADWREAAQLVRAGYQPGDLIVIAPRWAEPLGRQHLGDLMPAAMVGRADSARYARVWELSVRAARAEDTVGLVAEWSQARGRVKVARYPRRPALVTYDLVERFATARVTQAPLTGGADSAQRSGAASIDSAQRSGAPSIDSAQRSGAPSMEVPCLWGGPPPDSVGQRGEAGAFRCRGSRVERRTMEIDYRPRYGVVVPAEPGQRTTVEFADVPAEALRGATLHLWFGLHDYYARKTESGPVQVEVELAGQRVPVTVAPDRGWQEVVVSPGPRGAAGPGPGAPVVAPVAGAAAGPVVEAPPPEMAAIRLRIFARDARARLLGFAGEVRR